MKLKISDSGNVLLLGKMGPGRFCFMEQVFVRWDQNTPIANGPITHMGRLRGIFSFFRQIQLYFSNAILNKFN